MMFVLDQMSTHIAHIISEGLRRTGGSVVIEPSSTAVEDWALQIMGGAIAFAGMRGCTPGYLNIEGGVDKIPAEMQMKAARNSIWGRELHFHFRSDDSR